MKSSDIKVYRALESGELLGKSLKYLKIRTLSSFLRKPDYIQNIFGGGDESVREILQLLSSRISLNQALKKYLTKPGL